MRDRPSSPERRRRRLVIALGVVAAVRWLSGLAAATAVLVVIGTLPGHDPARASRATVIAASAFVPFALPAAAATAGWFVVRRERARDHDV